MRSPVQGQCALSVPTVGNGRSHEKGSVCKLEESLKSSALAPLPSFCREPSSVQFGVQCMDVRAVVGLGWEWEICTC